MNPNPMSRTYFPGTDTVETELPQGGTRVESFVDFVAWKFVFAHMHDTGGRERFVTNAQHMRFYRMCDGFGKMSSADLVKIGYDWSHVRDSSPAAFRAVADAIAAEMYSKTLADVVAERRELHERAGVPMIETCVW